MGEKISKAILADLVAKGGKMGPSMAELLECAPRSPDAALIRGTYQDAKEIVVHEWTFRIPNWAPTPVNKLYDHHWASRRKHKQSDAEIVAHYGRGIPKATGKRAVSLHVVFPPGKRMPDVDAYAKSLLDALVHCGLLVNDSSAWCVLNPVAYSRGQVAVSFVTVEDV